MAVTHPLREILEQAARGWFPPADGSVRFLPSPPGESDAVVGFTAHHVVAADLDLEGAAARLVPGDLGAPLGAPFLTWMSEQVGSTPGSLDVVLAAPGRASDGAPDGLIPAGTVQHARVTRAEAYRSEVEVYQDPGERVVVILGRGLAQRLELSLEIEPSQRGRDLGRRFIRDALRFVPDEEMVFAQVAPGNAASLRAFLASGFVPIASEVLFLRRDQAR